MGMNRIKARIRAKIRRHLLDAFDERGLARGMRVEFTKPNKCGLRQFETTQAGPGELLIETLTSVISPGTERAVYLQLPNVGESYPFTPGYSQVGRVIAAGSGCRAQVGEIVASSGGHASLHLCPADKAFTVPNNVPWNHAAFLQVALIALQGIRRAEIRPGERIVMLGAGLIGLLAAQFAKIAGGKVLLVARGSERLANGRACGLDQVLSTDSAPREELSSIHADVVIDATGHPQAMMQGFQVARSGARLILLGSNRGISEQINLGTWSSKHISVVGAHICNLPAVDESHAAWPWKRECRTVLDLLAQKRLLIEPLISRVASPDEAPEVYAELADPSNKSITTIFDWTQEQKRRNTLQRVSPLRMVKTGIRRLLRLPRNKSTKPCPPPTDGKLLRFGLIGCGEIAVENAKGIHASGNATITYACDLDLDLAQGVAAATTAVATTDIQELLDSPTVDAVLICTPHHLHSPLAIRAAEAGKHVVVEKPMATTVEDCDRMIEAAQHHGVTLSVCYCQRFEPRAQQAKKIIAAGALGEILSTRISFAQHRGKDYWTGGLTGRVSSDWRCKKETAGGGVLIMNACHILDYITWLAQEEITHIASCAATLVHPTEVEDTISLSYQYANGAIGTLDATNAIVGPGLFEQVIYGREGQLVIGPQLRFWSNHTVEGYEAGRWHVVRNLPPSTERQQFFEAFTESAWKQDVSSPQAQEARNVQATIEAAYLAMESQASVKVCWNSIEHMNGNSL